MFQIKQQSYDLVFWSLPNLPVTTASDKKMIGNIRSYSSVNQSAELNRMPSAEGHGHMFCLKKTCSYFSFRPRLFNIMWQTQILLIPFGEKLKKRACHILLFENFMAVYLSPAQKFVNLGLQLVLSLYRAKNTLSLLWEIQTVLRRSSK